MKGVRLHTKLICKSFVKNDHCAICQCEDSKKICILIPMNYFTFVKEFLEYKLYTTFIGEETTIIQWTNNLNTKGELIEDIEQDSSICWSIIKSLLK